MSNDIADIINEKTKAINRQIRSKDFFDPRIMDESGSRTLWSSESVQLAMSGIVEGYKLKESPFLKTTRDALLRKAGLPFNYTEDELEVLKLVWKDKMFFCNNFGTLKDGDRGWVPIQLRDYQTNLLHKYTQNRWNIVMFPRQSGKTTTTVLEIVHFMISNIDKDCVVIAQSEKVVNETLSKIKECFAGLPFFMQPGFISFNKKGCVLDNGCRLSIGIASESVVQGFSLDLLYIDEFAYIKNSMVDRFWNNIYPTLINNPNSRCIITSTPNGRNKFHTLWVGAEEKTNKFKSYRIYWYDVPGRDEQFKADTIANVGIEGWEMGFECSFDTQLKSIFNSKIQKHLRFGQSEHQHDWHFNNHPVGNKFEISFINQNIIQYNLKNDYFLLGIDLGEGLGQDDTVLKIKKVEWSIEKKCLIYKSVGVYRNNDIAVEDFAQMNLDLLKEFDSSKIRVVVENNNYGGEYFNQIDNLKKYEEVYYEFDNIVFAQFERDSKKDFERGVRWNGSNKKVGVKAMSSLISKGEMEETHYSSIEQYLNFGRMKNDTFAAQYGHDDLVMPDVTIAYFVKSNNLYARAFLNEITYNLRLINNDVDEKIAKHLAEEKEKRENMYSREGFIVRNHSEYLKGQRKDVYVL